MAALGWENSAPAEISLQCQSQNEDRAATKRLPENRHDHRALCLTPVAAYHVDHALRTHYEGVTKAFTTRNAPASSLTAMLKTGAHKWSAPTEEM